MIAATGLKPRRAKSSALSRMKTSTTIGVRNRMWKTVWISPRSKISSPQVRIARGIRRFFRDAALLTSSDPAGTEAVTLLTYKIVRSLDRWSALRGIDVLRRDRRARLDDPGRGREWLPLERRDPLSGSQPARRATCLAADLGLGGAGRGQVTHSAPRGGGSVVRARRLERLPRSWTGRDHGPKMIHPAPHFA